MKKQFYILLLPFFISCALFRPSAEKLTSRALAAHKQYDAIIVPGIPFFEPKWDQIMQMRVLYAIHLYKNGTTKKIIMSGGAVYSPYVEANIMKLYAIEFGVPEQDIIVEVKSQHSVENIWNSYKLAKSLGHKNIALCTDPVQTKSTYRFGRRRLKDLYFLPVVFDTLKTLPKNDPIINYQPYKIENFIPITESQSFWYRLMGTLGKRINFNK